MPDATSPDSGSPLLGPLSWQILSSDDDAQLLGTQRVSGAERPDSGGRPV